MNTPDIAASAHLRVGLIELPDLAEALTRCGLLVVTGPDFRAAATAIIAESKTAAFPIIVADVPAPGLRAWVGHLQQKTPVKVAVVRNPDAPVVIAESVAEILLPTTVNSILAAVGLAPLEGTAGASVFPAVAEPVAPAGIDLPGLDFFDDEPDTIPAPADLDFFAPAPATPTAATRSADADEDWDSVAAPAEPAALTPAPLTDDWDTPAETFAFPAAPVPAPATQPAPVFTAPAEDDWDTPAPVATADEAVPGSRRAARAAMQQDGPATAQDFRPVPVTQPAPVMAAPVEDWTSPVARPAPVMAAPAEDFGDWDTPELPVVPVHVSAPVPAENYFTPGAPQAPQPFVQAAPGASAWGHLPKAPAPEHDSTGIFDDFEASKLIGTGRSAAGLGALVINYSGKGGVGKSTTSLQLASVAADAGLRVVLIDGNSGQGDLRTYLRLNRTNLPTMYDAAIGNIRDAILTPATINANREQNLGEIKFAFIGAPPDDINDPLVVTDALYRDVIHFARRNADLVIMDTQIVESADRTGVVNMLILPALVQDAWGIGVTDMSTVGVNNLNNRLRKFINEGVPTSRLMVTINQVHPEQVEMAAKAVNYFRNLGTYLGAVEADINVKHDMNAGRINTNNAQLRAVMSKALLRITGNEAFREAAEYTPDTGRRSGLFGRLLGRKAA